MGWGGGRGGENEWKEGLRRVEGRSSQKKLGMEWNGRKNKRREMKRQDEDAFCNKRKEMIK